VGGQRHVPADLPRRKTRYPGPVRTDAKNFAPTGIHPRTFQTVTSLYTGSSKGAVLNSKFCEILSLEIWKFPEAARIRIVTSCKLYLDFFYDAVRRYDCWIRATSCLCFCRNNVGSRNTFGKSNRPVPSDRRITTGLSLRTVGLKEACPFGP